LASFIQDLVAVILVLVFLFVLFFYSNTQQREREEMEAATVQAPPPVGMFLWQGSHSAYAPNEGHVPQYVLYRIDDGGSASNELTTLGNPNQQQVVWIPMNTVLPSAEVAPPQSSSKDWMPSVCVSDVEDGVGYPTGHPNAEPPKKTIVSTIEASWKVRGTFSSPLL